MQVVGTTSYPFSSYYIQNGYPENLIELIVNGATSIYEKMVKDFTNDTISNTVQTLIQIYYIQRHI